MMDALFENLSENLNAIRRASIAADGKTFVLNEAGQPMMIVGVEDEDGIFDAVGYFQSAPNEWFLALGLATILGENAILRAARDGSPIELVCTPQTWLRRSVSEGEKFACILNWSVSPILNLAWCRTVRCENEALRDRLEDAIARFRAPFLIELAGSAEVSRPEARRAA